MSTLATETKFDIVPLLIERTFNFPFIHGEVIDLLNIPSIEGMFKSAVEAGDINLVQELWPRYSRWVSKAAQKVRETNELIIALEQRLRGLDWNEVNRRLAADQLKELISRALMELTLGGEKPTSHLYYNLYRKLEGKWPEWIKRDDDPINSELIRELVELARETWNKFFERRLHDLRVVRESLTLDRVVGYIGPTEGPLASIVDAKCVTIANAGSAKAALDGGRVVLATSIHDFQFGESSWGHALLSKEASWADIIWRKYVGSTTLRSTFGSGRTKFLYSVIVTDEEVAEATQRVAEYNSALKHSSRYLMLAT